MAAKLSTRGLAPWPESSVEYQARQDSSACMLTAVIILAKLGKEHQGLVSLRSMDQVAWDHLWNKDAGTSHIHFDIIRVIRLPEAMVPSSSSSRSGAAAHRTRKWMRLSTEFCELVRLAVGMPGPD